MKKRIALFCAVVMLLTLAVGCTTTAPKTTDNPEEDAVTTTEPPQTPFGLLKKYIEDKGEATADGYAYAYEGRFIYEGNFRYEADQDGDLRFVCAWPEENWSLTIELEEGAATYDVTFVTKGKSKQTLTLTGDLDLAVFDGRNGEDALVNATIAGKTYFTEDSQALMECGTCLRDAMYVISDHLPSGVTIRDLGFNYQD
ncbi:MAG: hypothetical protein E7527_02920 [Ruminococcaceae bacterium]|nr:hypothetical protein [Oscillospiraceae bacterium]